MTSTRSSRELSDALSRHDATMKKRFQRALLCSFVINGAAWSAFAGQKTAPVFHDLGAQSSQTMQWTMTTADARAATSPAPTALFDNARKSAVAILDNSPLSPTSQAPSQKRLRNLPERESALETEKPRRAPSQNSSSQNSLSQNSLSQSKLQNNAQRESATTRVRSASQAQISPDWSEENAWHSNDYPLEHSDHSRDETARNSSQTSSTRSANDAQKSLDSTGKSARQSASTRAPSSEQNANARNNAPSSRRESVGASSPQSLAFTSKLGSSSNVASSQLDSPSSGASADSSSKRDGSKSESSTRSLPNEAQRESAQRESSKREPLIEPSKREPQQREPQQREPQQIGRAHV